MINKLKSRLEAGLIIPPVVRQAVAFPGGGKEPARKDLIEGHFSN